MVGLWVVAKRWGSAEVGWHGLGQRRGRGCSFGRRVGIKLCVELVAGAGKFIHLQEQGFKNER